MDVPVYRRLDVAVNELSGTIPASIGSLVHLEYVMRYRTHLGTGEWVSLITIPRVVV